MAFLVLAGVAVGSGLGYLVDRLAGTLPLFVVLGVFGGFVLALYAIYLETR
jgi:F0F1-type ATP synthase assembly protein I